MGIQEMNQMSRTNQGRLILKSQKNRKCLKYHGCRWNRSILFLQSFLNFLKYRTCHGSLNFRMSLSRR
jgi:hypothetical protein